MDINIKLRSEILEYSLILEEAINNLLLLNLGIFDGGNSTKLFGKKAGVTFKNKIDLLYDIDVLSKEENAALELLMIFRKKFLHDIECNSFLSIVSQFDNGLKNKFRAYLNEGQSINDEISCRTACSNLFLKNIKTIKNKVKAKRITIEEKNEIFQLNTQQIIFNLDLFYDLINDLFLILENADLKNEKVRNLIDLISEKCQQYINKSSEDKEIISNRNRLSIFLSDLKKIYNYFGIVKIDEEKIPNFQSYIDELKKLKPKTKANIDRQRNKNKITQKQ